MPNASSNKMSLQDYLSNAKANKNAKQLTYIEQIKAIMFSDENHKLAEGIPKNIASTLENMIVSILQ